MLINGHKNAANDTEYWQHWQNVTVNLQHVCFVVGMYHSGQIHIQSQQNYIRATFKNVALMLLKLL